MSELPQQIEHQQDRMSAVTKYFEVRFEPRLLYLNNKVYPNHNVRRLSPRPPYEPFESLAEPVGREYQERTREDAKIELNNIYDFIAGIRDGRSSQEASLILINDIAEIEEDKQRFIHTANAPPNKYADDENYEKFRLHILEADIELRELENLGKYSTACNLLRKEIEETKRQRDETQRGSSKISANKCVAAINKLTKYLEAVNSVTK